MKNPLSQASRTALRVLLTTPHVGAEIRAFLSEPAGVVVDPTSKVPNTLEDVAIRGAFAEGYRQVLRDFDQAVAVTEPNAPKPKYPTSLA
jgi:hypothetical protein